MTDLDTTLDPLDRAERDFHLLAKQRLVTTDPQQYDILSKLINAALDRANGIDTAGGPR